ncbi:MAG: 50S ribosomal protein L11 methyltransferase [Pseudomonadota bacterium]|nr:50S ribosomal protein L11 methyltransferase [Pseudomonadota bacterium]
MAWLEVKIRSERIGAEALETLLEDAGAVSVTLIDAENEPLFEPGVGETPLWNHVVITGLFEQGTDADTLLLQLAAAWAPRSLPELRFTELPEQDWVRAWLDDFTPMRFGNRLWVCPSWWLADDASGVEWTPPADAAAAWEERHADLLRDVRKPGTAILRLDPGLAFGTGTHPTTSLCLQWLDAQTLDGLTLIDYGCGSGILGLAALLLGAHTVHGIDNDPQALTATTENCRKNRLDAARFPLYLPDAWMQKIAREELRADGMMANILAGTLIQLAETLNAQVKLGGWILLSGILREQADAVITAYTPWFKDFDLAAEGDWVRITAIRK